MLRKREYNPLMIWVIAFFIIILISSVLAYRSMRDYEEFPESGSLNSVFFIAKAQIFTAEILKKIHEILLRSNQFFSLEKLYKGEEKVLVLYGPKELSGYFPQLNMVELEDYVSDNGLKGDLRNSQSKKVSPDEILTWYIEPKRNSKTPLQDKGGLEDLKIGEDQKIFIQAVLSPQSNGGEQMFQATLRIMVADSDSIARVNLAKKVELAFSQSTGLLKHNDEFSEAKKFDSYKMRTLIPKEVEPFPLSVEEILAIVA